MPARREAPAPGTQMGWRPAAAQADPSAPSSRQPEVQTQDCMPKQSTGWIFSTSHLITHSHRHLRHQSSHLPLVICTIILLYISSKLWLDYDDLIFSEKRLALYPSTRDLYLVFQTSKYVHDYSYNRYRLFLEVRSYIYNFS